MKYYATDGAVTSTFFNRVTRAIPYADIKEFGFACGQFMRGTAWFVYVSRIELTEKQKRNIY